ncbi:hypothetical protein BCU49_019260 [Vibrio breoganii]
MEKLLDEKYDGDPHFARAISKNFLHESWETEFVHEEKFTLLQLDEGFELGIKNGEYRKAQKAKWKSKRLLQTKMVSHLDTAPCLTRYALKPCVKSQDTNRLKVSSTKTG